MTGPGPSGGQTPQLDSDMLRKQWARFEGGEKFVYYGGGLLILAWLFGTIGGWLDVTWPLIGAIVAMGAVWARHQPSMKISWPAPFPTILLIITVVTGLLVLIPLLRLLSVLSTVFAGGGILAALGVVLGVIGAVLMLLGAYRLYQGSRIPAPPAPPAA